MTERRKSHYGDEEQEHYRSTSPRRGYEDRSPYQPQRPKRDGWDGRGFSTSAKLAAVPKKESCQSGPTPKRPVELDSNGIPIGKMLKPFKANVKSMARALDPSEGYLG
jgi:hypothetical protein